MKSCSLATLLTALLVACSGAEKPSDGSSAIGSSDRVVVDASAATRQAIGVSTWGIRDTADAVVVHGYDARRASVLAFTYRATPAVFEATVDVGLRHGSLRVAAGASVLEDSLDASTKGMLARMVADLRAGTGRSLTLGTRSLVSPGEAQPLIECNQQLTDAAANGGETTKACSDDPGSASCEQGTAQAPKDQHAAKECKNESCTDAPPPSGNGVATRKGALTGPGTSSLQWHVNGTDLGIPFALGKGSTGFLFGDSFDAPGVGGPGWRSPVLLRSSSLPADGIVFGGAGYAPQIIDSPHTGCNGEFTVIPNDGVLLPDGRTVVSFMSVRNWKGICPDAYPGQWRTSHAGLAWTTEGDHFTRAPIQFGNDPANQDPFQMQSLQLDGDYVYVYSVRAGRQPGPMMLQRVPHKAILDKGAYECLGDNATWGKPCKSILPEADFGEPSVRRLAPCVWAMAYLAGGRIVTRTASKPEGPWSDEHVQLTFAEKPCLYGGFIHPSSTASELHLMVSAWGDAAGCGTGSVYGVDHFVGAL